MSLAAILRPHEPQQIISYLRQHKYVGKSTDAYLDHGERLQLYLNERYGAEATVEFLLFAATGTGRRLPYGCYRELIVNELGMKYTDAKRMAMTRSFVYYAKMKSAGAITRMALRGDRARTSQRGGGGKHNSKKAGVLGYYLLQYFVDVVKKLHVRSDSHLLLKKARDLRVELLRDGHDEYSLPKLIGNAGAQWFKRWRQERGISMKVTGMKMKVSWTKVVRRVKVLLSNLFRLKAFWEHCHPGKTMRFISLDQKPSWCNNAGSKGTFDKKGNTQPGVKENHAQTCQRYTILTTVPSWGNDDSSSPPRVAILFKAKRKGVVWNKLQIHPVNCKPWMQVQCQQFGSYRSEDVVEALEWMLPDANDSSESIIVMLDWFSGHLTEEVAECIKRKGHVLVLHGGGTTPFTQVNDTHLHAQLQRILINLEIDWALEERQRLMALQKVFPKKGTTPSMNRYNIMSLVQTAWLSIDHNQVAQLCPCRDPFVIRTCIPTFSKYSASWMQHRCPRKSE